MLEYQRKFLPPKANFEDRGRVVDDGGASQLGCVWREEKIFVGVLAWRSGGERGCMVVLKMFVG
ncbi:hypothetical protein CXB51_022471 [Gossypium anomalum]|uniref:Uncharacterized protein n=1 Tax=Gossypium anomalum TaxID=47600 RepID=A0A8J6CV77_9ROSI|nr:hypothetical protein CXB51_022471 [Gossypium anomalum]